MNTGEKTKAKHPGNPGAKHNCIKPNKRYGVRVKDSSKMIGGISDTEFKRRVDIAWKRICGGNTSPRDNIKHAKYIE